MIYDLTTMYYGIRFVLSIILVVILFIKLIRGKLNIVPTFALSFLVWFFIYIILTFMPVENLFLGFDTPEEAFHYNSNMDILMVDEYDDYALIVAELDDDDSQGIMFYILNKKGEKWKINVYTADRDYVFSESKVKSKSLCLTKLYIPNSNDCFIICDSTYLADNNVEKVSDNRNTKFKYFDVPIDGVIDFYYGVIEDIDSDYECYVDGETITFN